jgi:hypothetical protein
MICEAGTGIVHVDLSKARWRKSSRSGGAQNCVEVADSHHPSIVGVRDSKDHGGSALVFTRREWNAFIAQVKLDKLY